MRTNSFIVLISLAYSVCSVSIGRKRADSGVKYGTESGPVDVTKSWFFQKPINIGCAKIKRDLMKPWTEQGYVLLRLPKDTPNLSQAQQQFYHNYLQEKFEEKMHTHTGKLNNGGNSAIKKRIILKLNSNPKYTITAQIDQDNPRLAVVLPPVRKIKLDLKLPGLRDIYHYTKNIEDIASKISSCLKIPQQQTHHVINYYYGKNEAKKPSMAEHEDSDFFTLLSLMPGDKSLQIYKNQKRKTIEIPDDGNQYVLLFGGVFLKLDNISPLIHGVTPIKNEGVMRQSLVSPYGFKESKYRELLE